MKDRSREPAGIRGHPEYLRLAVTEFRGRAGGAEELAVGEERGRRDDQARQSGHAFASWARQDEQSGHRADGQRDACLPDERGCDQQHDCTGQIGRLPLFRVPQHAHERPDAERERWNVGHEGKREREDDRAQGHDGRACARHGWNGSREPQQRVAAERRRPGQHERRHAQRGEREAHQLAEQPSPEHLSRQRHRRPRVETPFTVLDQASHGVGVGPVVVNRKFAGGMHEDDREHPCRG